jgi:hypothetical protein
MNKILLLISTLFSGFVIADNWGVFLELVHDKYVGLEYENAKQELALKNKKEVTPEKGTPRPDGGRLILHSYLWVSISGKECHLDLDVNAETNIIEDISISGELNLCRWEE